MKASFKAVIFDCDGLLLDTEQAYTMAERRSAPATATPTSKTRTRLLLGSSFEAAGRIFESLPEEPGRATELSAEFVEIRHQRRRQ
jgi:beta-phosphoglucomutase-like phosphatase (HAD superfamily)